jgi:UDP-glucose 4-epimerase
MMTLNDAVDLVLYAFEHAKPGEIYVQKAPAATIETLARTLADLLSSPDHEIRIMGTRHGEKQYEALLSREEMASARDLDRFYCIPPDLRDLNYDKYIDYGEPRISEAADYNSHNTRRLESAELRSMLLKLDFIRAIIRDGKAEPED